jgi:hypothetical protein
MEILHGQVEKELAKENPGRTTRNELLSAGSAKR